MSDASKWSDLMIRLGSAVLMVVVGLLALLFGGHVFHVIVAVICGLMMWELVRMVAPLNAPLALQLGILSGLASFVAIYIPTGFALPLLLVPAFVGFAGLVRNRVIYMVFSVMVLLASNQVSYKSNFPRLSLAARKLPAHCCMKVREGTAATMKESM